MERAPGFAGVILAAGESSRMGKDKAMLPWPPAAEGLPETKDTFLSAAIRSLSLSTDFVVVVASKNQGFITPAAYAEGATVVVNPEPERGQFSSLQVGLQEVLNRGRDTAIITLVDRPPASATTIQGLRDAYTAAGNETWAVVPEFCGRHGHPYVAGRELIEAFLRASPTENARDIEHALAEHISYVAVDDPMVTMNINTPEEYRALLGRVSM